MNQEITEKIRSIQYSFIRLSHSLIPNYGFLLKFRIIVLILLIFLPCRVYTQYYQPNVYISAGPGINLSFFDIGGGSPGPSFFTGVSYSLKDNWLAGINISFHRTRGTDEDTPNEGRGYAYYSNIFELTGRVIYKFTFNSVSGRSWIRKINPVLFAGGGFLQFRPTTYWFATGENIDINDDYLPMTPIVNIGAGFFYNLNKTLSISIEGGPNFAVSDYLDGYSDEDFSNSRDMYHVIAIRVIWKEPMGF